MSQITSSSDGKKGPNCRRNGAVIRSVEAVTGMLISASEGDCPVFASMGLVSRLGTVLRRSGHFFRTAFFAFVVFVALGGCAEQAPVSSSLGPVSVRPASESVPPGPSDNASASERVLAGHPREFFPSQVGTTWTYEIELVGGDPPLKYEETSWPIGADKSVMYATRGIIYNRSATTPDEQRRNFALKISVKRPAAKQGRLQYPLGVELSIDHDELGVFSEAKQVFWAISDSARFNANLVVTVDSDSPSAPSSGGFGRWGQGDGSAMRLLFFGDRPGIGIGLKDSPDKLLFRGVRANVENFDGNECLYFTRTVDAAKSDRDDLPQRADGADRLSRAFREEMWFARGKGLVRLEQIVDDKPTMTWTLKQILKGGP